MLKIPLFHMRRPKNKLSSESASSANVLPLVLGWKSCSVTKCPHTLAVCVHPPGEGLLQPRGEGCKGREKSAQTPSGIQDAPSPCAHHICEANAAPAPLAEPQLRRVWEHRELLYPGDLGALITDFHEKPTIVPVTCPGTGKEPVAVQEMNPKVA